MVTLIKFKSYLYGNKFKNDIPKSFIPHTMKIFEFVAFWYRCILSGSFESICCSFLYLWCQSAVLWLFFGINHLYFFFVAITSLFFRDNQLFIWFFTFFVAISCSLSMASVGFLLYFRLRLVWFGFHFFFVQIVSVLSYFNANCS